RILFYVGTFGFPLIKVGEKYFNISIGLSQLVFTSENVKGNPYYHLAFNIYANKFDEAKLWVKRKSSIECMGRRCHGDIHSAHSEFPLTGWTRGDLSPVQFPIILLHKPCQLQF